MTLASVWYELDGQASVTCMYMIGMVSNEPSPCNLSGCPTGAGSSTQPFGCVDCANVEDAGTSNKLAPAKKLSAVFFEFNGDSCTNGNCVADNLKKMLTLAFLYAVPQSTSSSDE